MLRVTQIDRHTAHLGFLLHFLQMLFDRDFRGPHDCLTFPDVLIALEYWKGEKQNIRFLRSYCVEQKSAVHLLHNASREVR